MRSLLRGLKWCGPERCFVFLGNGIESASPPANDVGNSAAQSGVPRRGERHLSNVWTGRTSTTPIRRSSAQSRGHARRRAAHAVEERWTGQREGKRCPKYAPVSGASSHLERRRPHPRCCPLPFFGRAVPCCNLPTVCVCLFSPRYVYFLIVSTFLTGFT